MKIGVISDTHGLVRPEAIAALQGTDLILHAGDIGSATVLDALNELAPVVAIRGNNDKGDWAENIPETQEIEMANVSIYMLHDLKQLDFDPGDRDIRVVISGHSHKPLMQERDGVLYLNPGSAGRRRFKLPITVAALQIKNQQPSAEIVDLAVP
jgi:hypothetical protein